MPEPPEVKSGEKQDDYVGRCMEAVSAWDKPEEQKLAACYAKFRGARKAQFIDAAIAVFKAIFSRAAKAALPVGHVTTRADGTRWKKTAPGKWEQVRPGENGGQDTSTKKVTSGPLLDKTGPRTPEESLDLKGAMLDQNSPWGKLYSKILDVDSSQGTKDEIEGIFNDVVDGKQSFRESINSLSQYLKDMQA